MRGEKSIFKLKPLLDEVSDRFNRPDFIADDPISIPHRYTRRQDIEIAGLFAATLAWGQRKTIIRSCEVLMNLMDNAPFEFVVHHRQTDLRRMQKSVHRTFNATDLLYFIAFLKHHFTSHNSLESLFRVSGHESNTEQGLIRFHDAVFSLPHFPSRSRKHVATPARNSACKRLNMFLRWMVRKDDRGVDFGLWREVLPSQLICPVDLHVDRVARRLRLIRRKPLDWRTAVELTENLKLLDPADPVRYDYALFGLGLMDAGRRRVSAGR